MMKNTIQKVGLIGLGLMGHGIGRNLLKNGFALTILGNVNRKPVESLIGLGAAEAIDIAGTNGQQAGLDHLAARQGDL